MSRHDNRTTLRSNRQRRQALCWTGLYVGVWLGLTAVASIGHWWLVRRWLDKYGTAGFYLIGLAWTVWGVEVAARRRTRFVRSDQRPAARVWNPLDLDAWYYGRRNQKLNQSIAVLLGYSLLFFLIVGLLGWLLATRESYELPAGGGQARRLALTIRIQKVIRTKYVVNPLSAIRFEVPPIEDVPLQLNEMTEHVYSVGYGKGTGPAGFGAGTALGKVRFIRLQYAGGDWDQDFGIGADLNMLLEYGIRTGQKVANRTESRAIAELRGFPARKSPPIVYLTGQKSIRLSKSEINVLRHYLLEQHGMLFGDNGGSRQFHYQFLAMMAAVLPDVEPVRIPLDDPIHRIPYAIPYLPYVAPHGGREALGWWTQNRWVCYYHPGDIADAWCDGHAGVRREIWEVCYQLGTNIIYYAHLEYAKWLAAQTEVP